MLPFSDNSPDQELIAAINAGDTDAFECLYHRYRDWVVRLAWRFTGHHDDSLDVLQETFSYVAGKFPGFELTASMTTFLYPAVRNLSIAARRKRQRSVSSEADLNTIADRAVTQVSGPSTEFDADELGEVLTALSDAHREILLMRFVDDMTQPEIADALDLPLGTVKSRLHHAVQAVRKSPAVLQYLTSQTD
jgi:RNA polymerase sigma-70 factor, ECF subfamily